MVAAQFIDVHEQPKYIHAIFWMCSLFIFRFNGTFLLVLLFLSNKVWGVSPWLFWFYSTFIVLTAMEYHSKYISTRFVAWARKKQNQ